MTRHLFIFPIVWLCSCLLASSADSTPSRTLRVPADHPSIQAALDHAQTGDTVLVSAGSYHDHIQLKDGVCLRSEGDDSPGTQEYGGRRPLKRAEQTIIDVQGSTKGAVVAGAEGATLDGFTITGLGHVNHHLPGHAHAVECRNCSATIINNIIRDNGSTGIGQHALKGGAEGRVAAPYVANNFVFRNKGIGIGNNHRSQTVIINNVVFENHEAGIGARNEAAPLIEGNVVFDNGRGYKSLDAVECKKFDKDQRSLWPGIGIKDGARAIVRKNKVSGNALCGISVDNGAFALIEENDVRDNQMPGIGIGGHRAATAVIRKNTVRGNRGPGIGVNIGSDATIIENAVGPNGEGMPGIAVVDGSTASVIGNSIEPGPVAGIAVISATATVSGNQIAGPQKTGIRVDNSVATLDNNHITRAGAVGMMLNNSRVTVTRNKINGSAHHGILIAGKESRASVAANILEDNAGSGGAHIFLAKESACRLAANEFRSKARLGDVFRSKTDAPIAAADKPTEMIKKFRMDPALLGPGPTENYFKTGKPDHPHKAGDHDHDTKPAQK